MKSFFQISAFAALIAYEVQAACVANPDTAADDCAEDFAGDADTAISTFAEDYQYTYYEAEAADEYITRMMRFLGEADGTAVTSTKGSILLLHDTEQDCLNWFENANVAASGTQGSIPVMLYKDGFDVWIGCRRGTAPSFKHATLDLTDATDLATYWDFDSTDIGKNDIPAMVGTILKTYRDANADACNQVQIVTSGLSAQEALWTANQLPTATGNYISSFLNIAPCVVTSYQQDSSYKRELKAIDAEDDQLENSRLLNDIFQEDLNEARELHGRHGSYYYWNNVKRHCAYYPSSCYNYCSDWPHWCNDFCYYLPEFCTAPVPTEVADLTTYLKVLSDNDIDVLYDADWSDNVDTICTAVGSTDAVCVALTATLTADPALKPMSVKQLEQMWQTSYTHTFSKYSSTFGTDAGEHAVNSSLSGIKFPVNSIYKKSDTTCVNETQQAIYNKVSTVGSYVTQTDMTAVDHYDVIGQWDNAGFYNRIMKTLMVQPETAVTDCTAATVDDDALLAWTA